MTGDPPHATRSRQASRVGRGMVLVGKAGLFLLVCDGLVKTASHRPTPRRARGLARARKRPGSLDPARVRNPALPAVARNGGDDHLSARAPAGVATVTARPRAARRVGNALVPAGRALTTRDRPSVARAGDAAAPAVGVPRGAVRFDAALVGASDVGARGRGGGPERSRGAPAVADRGRDRTIAAVTDAAS